MAMLFCNLLLLQAIEWLKAHIKAAGQAPEVLPQHDLHFQNSLELAVRFGKVSWGPTSGPATQICL